ncbi:hypothetical protein [Noviherbaspirillum sp.]|jgi:hypothetical protein|uniref:hypothetical protein n=1 Tax=Noviherbaspirillum sp. TaxID=1926288 RepID=UPI0025ECD0A9|nr:hypothetical protein [Noviherbaspirillum sp.]
MRRPNPMRGTAVPVETMSGKPEEPARKSGQESPPTQEKSEDIAPNQMSSEQKQEIAEVQHQHYRSELHAEEPRGSLATASLENPSLLDKDAAPAPREDINQEDVNRTASQPKDRGEEPTRQQLKQVQQLLSELQQAHRERFEHLDQVQNKLTELAALISKAMEGEGQKIENMAEPGSPDLPKLKGEQRQWEAEPEQMQTKEQAPQVMKNAGERKSLSDAFKLFKKLK